MRKLLSISLRAAAGLLVVILIAVFAGILVFRSGWFREKVRTGIVDVLTRGTGGEVDLGQFDFDWKSMTASVGPLIIHGREAQSERPFLRVGSVKVGLRIISLMDRKVDLASAQIDRPEVHIVIYGDGSNNIPSPGQRTPNGKNWAEELLNIKIRRYEVTNGFFELDQRRTPLNLAGENLHLVMNFNPTEPSYDGQVTSDQIRVSPAGKGPIQAGVDADFVLNKDGFRFPRMRVKTAESTIDLTGSLADVKKPHGEFALKAKASIREAVGIFVLPIGPQGDVDFDGKMQVDFGSPFLFAMQGHANARGVGYARDRIRIQNGTLSTDLELTEDSLVLSSFNGTALGARIQGRANLARWRRFQMDANVSQLDLKQAINAYTDRAIPWSGTLTGPVHLETDLNGRDAKIKTTMTVAPGDTMGVEGLIDASYDRIAGTLELGNSWIATPESRVEVAGTLGKVLRTRLRTTNPDDLLPALQVAMDNPPQSLPLKLTNGVAIAEGTVSGPLNDVHFSGIVSATSGSVEGHGFDRFGANLEADKRAIRAERVNLGRGNAEVTGSVTLTARNDSFEDAGVVATLNLRGADVASLLKEAGSTLEISGLASATARVAGTIKNPEADITADIVQVRALEEQFDHFRTTVRYKSDLIEVTSGQIDDGPANIRFGGTYRRTGADWQSGELTWDAATQNLPITSFDRVAKLRPEVRASITGRGRGAAQIANGQFLLRSATADFAANGLEVSGSQVGNLALGVETNGDQMQVLATGRIRESNIEARGAWTLAGTYPGSGTLKFSRLSLATIEDLVALRSGPVKEPKSQSPFEGFLEGAATFSAPLRSIQDGTAELTLTAVQINPKANAGVKLGVQPQDIIFKNDRPVVVTLNSEGIRLRDAHFTGRDTNLEASGILPLKDGSGADFAMRGNVNLILLQALNPDLTVRGDVAVQASVRGSLSAPQVNGRLELKGASVYFSDLPNGIDNANGTIIFDRTRATIDKLTAETGGGTLALSGNVELGTPLSYRVQVTAQQVRIRWPDDLSSTYNARLGLVGNTEASTLSGTLTLTRAAFNPRTDLGQLLTQASKPTPTPSAPNEFLRNMQLEVRIENEPNFTFETSLTRDVQAEVDLNLHGTPIRPVLLGNVTVNQGEVQVFGNKYTIDRGEVHFINPVKIEPVFDMNLETRARGITVNVTFAGTMQQLRVNYSSDPPLQSSEIIALLAVGRDPVSASNTTVGTSSSAPSGLAAAGSGLLGQAVNAQISSRLQRFFGASRVKIDPTLTGVDNLPQARLTIEQQVSKDITLTYITNLNRTQEQLVRLQWDLNRNWSAIAVRDQNGLFGVDFQYRKRF